MIKSFKELYNSIKENRGHEAEKMISRVPKLKQDVINKALDLFGISIDKKYTFEHVALGERLNLDLDDPNVWISGIDRAACFADYIIYLDEEKKPLYVSIKVDKSNTSLVSAGITKKPELIYKLLKFNNGLAKKQFNTWYEKGNWDPDLCEKFMEEMKFDRAEVLRACRGLFFNGTPYCVITINPEEGVIVEESCYLINEKTLGTLELEEPRFFFSHVYDRPVSECTVSIVSGGQAFEKIDFRIRFRGNGERQEVRLQLDPKAVDTED